MEGNKSSPKEKGERRTLDDILAQCDTDSHEPKDLWHNDQPVGEEML